MKCMKAFPFLLVMMDSGFATDELTHSIYTEAETGTGIFQGPINDFDRRELEEMIRTGTDNIPPEIPHHLLVIDEDGNHLEIEHSSDGKKSSRKLSSASARIGDFGRLECNPTSWDCSSNVSDNLPSGNNPLVVPCGVCYNFDIAGNVTFDGGIDIVGKLLFPVNHQAIIHTPFVFVQGELELSVDHQKVSPENKATTFILTGTNDVIFNPTESPNENACDSAPGGQCNVGKKPFLVAGGKVNINAISDSCITHTPIQKKIIKDPSYDPNDFQVFTELPDACPISGHKYFSYDFENANFGNWTGRPGTFLVSGDGNSMTVTNRKMYWQGPYLDLTPLRPDLCLVPNQDYILEARLKLDMANGTMYGEDTTCKQSNQHCPEINFIYRTESAEVWRRIGLLHQHIAPTYGEYVNFTSRFTFSEDDLNALSSSNIYQAILIENPEPGIDITIDTFKFYLPSKPSYPDPDALCKELIFNGDAESNEFNPYPFYTVRGDEKIKVVEEEGNKFFRLFDRVEYRSSLQYTMDTSCFTRGVSYTISSRVRYHYSENFVGGSEPYYWYIRYRRGSDNSIRERLIVNCAAQSVRDGWVQCTGEFIIDADFAEASEVYLRMALANSRDGGKYNLDYDDISIRYSGGYVDEVVVDTNDVSCWGDDADVHVTSSIYYSWAGEKANGISTKILNITNNSDGTSNLQFSEAATLPIISQEDDVESAVEIALLSRNVEIQGETGETRKGGYMQILHTSSIAQTIHGVEFTNMGRRQEVDKFALQFLYSYNIEGTVVSRNSFRGSNQRCVSINGSSNITVSHNTAHQCFGHCIYVGYQSESNLILNNLVSELNDISYGDRISGESDFLPAAYLSWYAPNHYINNTVVASKSYGFRIEHNWRIRREDDTWDSNINVRTLRMGDFDGNTARSCANEGMLIFYHEAGGDLKNLKLIKNRIRGIYLLGSRNISLTSSLFVDNMHDNLLMRWADNIDVDDLLLRGVTSGTKSMTKPPYFNKPCISGNFNAPVGLRLPVAIQRRDDSNNVGNVGARISNVHFTNFDHDDECASSIPFSFYTQDDHGKNHFSYLTMLANVTLDGGNLIDAESSAQDGVSNIVIHDIDGSSSPIGNSSAPGMFVSDLPRLQVFSGDLCTKFPRGISYCPNTCYRTISFLVDQFESETIDIRVTRRGDEKETLVSYNEYDYDDVDNVHRKHYFENLRSFSISLPAGEYIVEFLKDLRLAWPKFVLPQLDGAPDCEGYLMSEQDITIVEPRATSSTCNDLIINGDMEQGLLYWGHTNGDTRTQYGELLTVPGEGVNGTSAVRYYNRTSRYNGIGQNLDTRCIHESLNEFYEIEVYFRLENGTTPFICDRFSSSRNVQCPSVTFKQQKIVNGTLRTSHIHNRATVIMPNNRGEFNLIHGVFRVDEEIHSLQRIWMYPEFEHEDFDIIIDNTSVKKLAGICGSDLVRNGNFDEFGKYWQNYHLAHIDVVNLHSGNALKVHNRERDYAGAFSDFFIDKDCFEEKQRFLFVGKFTIASASNGTFYECDRTLNGGELECSYAQLEARSPIGNDYIWIAETIATAEDQIDPWTTMAGIATITEIQAAHSRLFLRFYGPHTNMDVFYDDISLVPIEKSCEQLVLNGDFEIGDSRFWRPIDRTRINVDISDSGAGGSNYSMAIQRYSWRYLYQDLDTRCVVEGQEFVINAQFRYVNATDLVSGVSCDPSMKSRGNVAACPTVVIRGTLCDSDDIEYVFWNEIDQDELGWDSDGFNKFENIFSIDANIAQCNKIRVELGGYVLNDRILLVDDIEITQRTTSPPTPSPTFSPTKSKNSGPTVQPTRRTDAPTTTNVVTCPIVGNGTITVDPGHVMIQTANASLCTLTKYSTSSEGYVVHTPIARSYNGKDWEQAAGEYADSLFDGEILCYDNGCQINLPELESGSNYILSSFSYTLSDRDMYARFLETATFGITEEQLDTFESTSNNVESNIISWVHNQMNETNTPMTSHRKFWRRGLINRLPTSIIMSSADHPCDAGTRWRKISFVRNDNLWYLETRLRVIGANSTNPGAGPFKLQFNDWTRTVVQNFTVDTNGYENYDFDPNYEYSFCNYPQETIGGRLYIQLEDGNCVWAQNPAINLDGYESTVQYVFDIPDGALEPIDESWSNGEELVYLLNTSFYDDPSLNSECSSLPTVPELGDEPIFGRLNDGSWLMFDPRMNLLENTPSSPIMDGGKSIVTASGGRTYCSNVPRTFLNEDQCQVTNDACRPSSNKAIDILLDNSTINAFNHLTDRYVYAVVGQLVKYDGINLDHPCTPGLRSRWELIPHLEDCNPTELYDNTNSSLFELLTNSGDINPFIRDIHFPQEGGNCSVADTEPQIEIEVDGQCWKRVHDEYMSVFDMTYWVDKHPGGAYNIQKWSQNNGTFLIYPSLLERRPHGMARWNNNWQKFTLIGRFGDYIRLSDLPNDLRRQEVMDYFDDSDESVNNRVFTCGSPGEISNEKSKDLMFDAFEDFTTLGIYPANNRKYVWIMIALQASDQLRQRVAWALAQILVVVTSMIGDARGNAEWFLAYYDIFVRNAFGNYRDILKEISFSPMMAENLSFLGSKSKAYMLERYRVKTSADENFAREIMQLFSIGLVQLNMDGSPKRNENGQTLLSYTNDDIMSFSRAWTGFDLQARRGNIEGGANRVDPMKIVPEWRDRFPKSDTTNGYIGDTYPLCADLPSESFLREGATYRFLGSSSLPELMTDPAEFQTQSTIERVVLDSSSQLRALLCNPDQNGNCSFENTVTIPSNLDCSGIECEVETVRVVQIEDDAFYEFVERPCVNFAFYNDAVKISPRYGLDKVMCANPLLHVASEACCSVGNVNAVRNSEYSGERVLFETAKERCSSINKILCDFYRVDGYSYLTSGYFWTSDSCVLRVKVKRDGTVAIVHQPSSLNDRVMHVSEDNDNFFKVLWGRGGDFPSVDDGCGGVCQVLPEGACLCNTGVIEQHVFDRMPASKAELVEKLHVGAVNPVVFNSGSYSSSTDFVTNITAHIMDGTFNSDTIFEFIDDKGRHLFMKNIRSSVYLRGLNSGFTGQWFRNTPQFMSFIPSETNLRDAQYETEATLDHYFYHDNTPPFISNLLIQRLVMSNPTPKYVSTVSHAFKNGIYRKDGIEFGTGEYGDMAATIAAIYLDDAAREVVLDSDLTSGALREPILKVTSLMRSMEFVSNSLVTKMDGLMNDIGQMAHEFTTVFSFFLKEFKPYGRVGDSKLVAPEATLLDMPKMVGLVNGLTSLVKYGLSNCQGGWGQGGCRENVYTTSSQGRLEFNRTVSETIFSFETFEGLSLNGGLDNRWVGRNFDHYNAMIVSDPTNSTNHVVHFPSASWYGSFFSPPVQTDGNSYVVKFRYFAYQARSGGCIGYVDARTTSLNTQTWVLCDDNGSAMVSAGTGWISCQFVVPEGVDQFRVVIGDRRNQGGDAFFDDIQIANGTTTSCSGVEIENKYPSGNERYSSEVVDRLSTLLTAGRLGTKSKAVITDAFDKAGSAEDGLRIAQQLIITSGEFHSTNIVESTNEARESLTFPEPTGKPYRAVVYILLNGGCDSFNMLTPYTCSNGLYESYLDVRQQVAIAKDRLLPISAVDQVCTEFGLHPELTEVQSLYGDEDLLFFANTGVLSKPVNKENYYALTNTQLESKRIDPYDVSSGTGILGRMGDVLSENGHNVGSFSVDRFSVALVGKPDTSATAQMIVDRNGIPQVYLDDTKEIFPNLHNTSAPTSGIFADTWSSALMDSINTNDLLSRELQDINTITEFPNTYLGNSFSTVSKLMSTREVRGVDVDTFYIETGGFDTHADVEENLARLFEHLDEAFGAFAREMKANQLWNNVTLIQTSDFARTLNPNGGLGTDHAWGGNYMMMGGAVKGGQIKGQYPEDLTEDGPYTLGRGRMIPTTPWEAAFRGIAYWLGIPDADMSEVCPNLHNFDSTHLIEPDELFHGLSARTRVPSAPPSIHKSTHPTKVTISPKPSSAQSDFPSFIPSVRISDKPSTPPTEFSCLRCSDAETGYFWIDEIKQSRDCAWAISDPAQQQSRCSLVEVADNCCSSCCNLTQMPSAHPTSSPSESVSCWYLEDKTTSNFMIAELQTKKNCQWAIKKPWFKERRCAYEEVQENCIRSCCNDPYPSSVPSIYPSNAPVVVSAAPTSVPSTAGPTPLASSIPTVEVCPDNCYGDAKSQTFTVGGYGDRDCDWAVSEPEFEDSRCALPEMQLNCCATCCSECVGDFAADQKFKIPEMNGIRRTCSWVGKKFTVARCAHASVRRKCCKTCNDAMAAAGRI